MADRYRVLAGNWNEASSWSTSSGGAGGASVPTASDNVFFDAATPTGTHTINLTANTLSLNFTGFTGTLAGSSALNIAGSLTMGAGMTRTYTGTITFTSTSAGNTITSNGIAFGASQAIALTGSGGVWTLGDNLYCGTVQLNTGTFTTNNYAVRAYLQSMTNNTRVLNLGSSTWTINGNVILTGSNLTVNPGTSLFTATTPLTVVNVPNITLYDIEIPNFITTGTGNTVITGPLTVRNFTMINLAGTIERTIELSSNITVTGTFTSNGPSVATRYGFRGTINGGTKSTISAAVVSISNTDFQDINATGAGSWTGTSLGNGGNNTGITFDTPVNRYWVGNGGSWSNTARWSTTSGGASGASVPLIHDNAIFDANSITSASQTITFDQFGICGFDMSAVLNNPSIAASVNSIFYGNMIFGSGVTSVMGSVGLTTRAYGNISLIQPSNYLTSTGTLNMYNQGTVLTLNSHLNIGTGASLFRAGTFDANDYNVTFGTINADLSWTKTWYMGSGTWTTANSGTILSLSSPLVIYPETAKVISTYSGSSSRTITSVITITLPDIDISNGAGTLTLTNVNTEDLNFTGFTGSLASTTMTIRGNLTLGTGMTVTGGSSLSTFAATSSGKTITTNGVSYDRPLSFDGVGGEWSLVGNFTSSIGATRSLSLVNGSLNLNGYTATFGTFSSDNSNVRSLIFSGGELNLNRTDTTTIWACSTPTNFTINTTGGGTIRISGSTANVRTFAGGGLTYPDLIFTNATANGFLDITQSNTFSSIEIIGVNQSLRFTAGTTTTIGDLIADDANITSITSAVHNLVKTGGEEFIRVQNCNISYSNVSPANKFYALLGEGNTNGGNNTGWIFVSGPVNVKKVNNISATTIKTWNGIDFIDVKSLNGVE
jgi:hypothetical protein